MTDAAAILPSWDDNAGRWAAAVRGGAIASRTAGTDAAIVDAVLALAPTTVLDVGCGEGWLCRALGARSSVVVTGVDGAAGLIALAATADPEGRYKTIDYGTLVRDPAAAPGPFDAIALNFALLDANPGPLLAALASRLAPRGALVIQTVHPWSACGDGPYADRWRTEDFAAFGGEAWTAMPWFFRTLESWFAVVKAAGLVVTDVGEPVHPDTGRPLSLVLTLRVAG